MFSQVLLLLLTAFMASVLALPLAKRDVVDPPILTPTAKTVWYVGQTQIVTWNSTGLPIQQTNPVGQLVLGYLFNNSEHLMLKSPLAINLNYSTGQAQITVPDVPTRSDYIVVLFGDSGNASPEFTIINDPSSSVPASTPPSQSSPNSPGSSSPAAATPTTPSSTNPNSPASSGGSSPAQVSASEGSPVGALPSPTASSTASGTHSSTTITVTASTTPSSNQSNSAWQKHAPSWETTLGATLAVIYLVFS